MDPITQPKTASVVHTQPDPVAPSGSRKLRAFAFFLTFLLVLLGAYALAVTGNVEVDTTRGTFFLGLAEAALWGLGLHNGGNAMEHFTRKRGGS